MKILVIFGSVSDRPVYEGLTKDLEKDFETSCKVLSAHRNPDELRELLEKDLYDLYIAGAGLAAHLPGVIASQVRRPVIGLPVNSVLSGLDSLFSILQMPFGVPVLTFGPDNGGQVRGFLNNMSGIKETRKLNVVVRSRDRDSSSVKKELDRLSILAKEKGYTLNTVDSPNSGEGHLNFVTRKEDILRDFVVNVPVLAKEELSHPQKALEIFDWAKEGGGAWMGTNNTRNALVWWDIFVHREEKAS